MGIQAIHTLRPATLILRRIASAIRLEGVSREKWNFLRDAAALLLRMRGELDQPASGERIVGRGKPDPLL
jgi:hypothetical protein